MRGEGGQASVEWVGLVLLVAVTLAALTRLAPDADGRSVASTLVQAVTKPRVGEERGGKRNDPRPPGGEASRIEGFTAPPLVPPGGRAEPAPRPALPGGRQLARGLRRRAGLAWRRAWLACLAYERTRYGFLHPESRFPGHTIGRFEAVRIANDCLSPVDLVRDWPLFRGR